MRSGSPHLLGTDCLAAAHSPWTCCLAIRPRRPCPRPTSTAVGRPDCWSVRTELPISQSPRLPASCQPTSAQTCTWLSEGEGSSASAMTRSPSWTHHLPEWPTAATSTRLDSRSPATLRIGTPLPRSPTTRFLSRQSRTTSGCWPKACDNETAQTLTAPARKSFSHGSLRTCGHRSRSFCKADLESVRRPSAWMR